jgi:general secretion pathway protein H
MISRSRFEKGFTLIEMIVVLTVLALLTVLLVNNGSRVSPATQARSAAQEISAALRSARSTALSTNQSIMFSLDVANRTYRWGQSPPIRLPDGVRISLLTSRDQLESDRIGRFRFDPDGGSSGGRVTIDGGGRIYWVGIDWLSGRVSLEQPPP